MKTSRGSWSYGIAILFALIVGLVVGSVLTAKTGRSPFGAGGAAPMWVASASPVTNGEVNFQNGFAPIAARDEPAVVNISSSKVVRTQGAPFFNNPLFEQFFGRQFQVPREQQEKSLGSGVIISPDGYILTNEHVVSGASDVSVVLGDRRQFKAKTIGSDPMTDVAVVKIQANDLPVIVFGDSSKVRVGDFALAIGNPFGLGQAVTMGIVSATGRANLGIEDYEDFIQTDAAINPGNSGGALVNVRGDLIGVNTAILAGSESGGNEGVGFAIPVNMARQVMDQIMKNGKVVRGYLGAYIQQVTPDIAKAFGLQTASGALVSDVEVGTPAARAGLRRGDVVTAINGQPVADSAALRLKIAMTPPGTTVRLKVLRNGTEQEIPVTLGELPAKQQARQNQNGDGDNSQGNPGTILKGMSVQDMTPDIASQLGLPLNTKGVVVTNVEAGSAADEANMARGDLIQEVNRRTVNNVRDFGNLAKQAGKQPILLLVMREGKTLYLAIQP